jgi:hypothetical protein
VEAENQTNGNQQPGPASDERSRRKKPKHPNWGGRPPGAGAPKGNLNGFKHGRRSRQLAEVVMFVAANPTTRATMVALANRYGAKQAKSEGDVARFFVNAITKGIKLENPEQARAITDLIRAMAEK